MPDPRWMKPAEVLHIEHSPNQGIWLPDGRIQGAVNITFSEETVERMRLGYMCVKCLEPFEVAWPVRCHVCGCPVRDKQAEYFAKEYAGKQHLGSSESLDDGGIRERAERAEREKS